MLSLPLRALSSEAFAEFGAVIDRDADCERFAINEGRTQRHHALARVDCAMQDGQAALSLFRAQPVDADFTLKSMERHPLGSQAFIPLGTQSYAIVVAPPGELDESRICGFLAHAQQSVSYHRGTWHHYLLALNEPSDFVVVDRIGPGNNCDELTLETPLQLQLPERLVT